MGISYKNNTDKERTIIVATSQQKITGMIACLL